MHILGYDDGTGVKICHTVKVAKRGFLVTRELEDIFFSPFLLLFLDLLTVFIVALKSLELELLVLRVSLALYALESR